MEVGGVSGECFVLRDGEENGAGVVVAGDDNRFTGRDFMKNNGGGNCESGASRGGSRAKQVTIFSCRRGA